MSLDDDWNDADRLSRQGRWEEAGPRWLALARTSAADGKVARAREAASRAADALRRDDRPAEAATALSMAWELGQATTVDALQLVAVHLDAGHVQRGLERAEAALPAATTPADRGLALDGLLNAQLLAGRIPEARRTLSALRATAEPSTQLAARFRTAALDRLDGSLSAADDALDAVMEALAPFAAAASGLAAAADERAEIALTTAVLARRLGRDPEPALLAARAHLETGEAAWQRARRRAGRLRNDALHAWVSLEEGDITPAAAGAGPLAYASGRGLVFLEAELLTLRGATLGDGPSFARSITLCAEAPLLRGRVRVLRAEAQLGISGGPRVAGEPEDLLLALDELVDDLPWTARALYALTIATADPSHRERADGLAAAALTALHDG